MKNYALLLACLGIINSFLCQTLNLDWGKKISGTSNESGSQLVTDQQGNVYTVGWFENTIDANPNNTVQNNLIAQGGKDVFVTKFSASANYIWSKQISGIQDEEGLVITLDQNENVIVAGTYRDYIDCNPGSGTFLQNSVSSTLDIFVIKLTPNGDFIWSQSIGGLEDDYPSAIKVNQQNEIILGGYFSSQCEFDPGIGNAIVTAAGSTDGFILKLTENGSFIWVKRIGGPGTDDIYGIDITSTNEIVATGLFSNTVNFDPGLSNTTRSSNGNYDAFCIKLSSNGIFQWVQTLGGNGGDISYGITAMHNSDIVFGGFFENSVDLNPGGGIQINNSAGSGDCFVVSLNANGQFNWAKSFGAGNFDYVATITSDSCNNLYIAGGYQQSFLFNSDNNFPLTSQHAIDAFIIKTNVQGAPLFVESMGGFSAQTLKSIHLGMHNDLLFTGSFFSDLSIDPNNVGSSLSASGQIDAFVVKWEQPIQPVSEMSDTILCSGLHSIPLIASQSGIWSQLSGPNNLQFATNNNDTTLVSGNFHTGSYFIEFSTLTSDCRNFRDTIKITSNSAVILNAPMDTSVCEGSMISLSANSNFPLVWDNNYVNGQPFVLNDTMIFVVSSTDSLGCIQSATVRVNALSKPPVFTPADTSICRNQSIILNGQGLGNLIWNDTIANQTTIQLFQDQQLVLTATSVNGCTATDTLTIQVYDLPPISAGPNIQICEETSILLNATGGINYQWSNGIINGNYFTPDTSQIVVVTGFDSNGCGNADTLEITLFVPQEITASVDSTLCIGDSINLSATGPSQIYWSHGLVNGSSYFPVMNEVIYAYSTELMGCSDTFFVSLTVHPLPIIPTYELLEKCEDDSILITFQTINSNLNYSTFWGSNLPFIYAYNQDTLFNIIAIDTNGCINSGTLEVINHNKPTILMTTNSTVCKNDSLLFQAISSGILTWIPDTILNNNWYSLNEPDWFTVSAQNDFGCIHTDSIYINVFNPELPILSTNYVNGCFPQFVSVNTTSVCQNCNWFVNDLAISAQDQFSIDNLPPGCHEISYSGTDQNGCQVKGQLSEPICIYPNPISSFYIDQTDAFCDFSNLSEEATSYIWDFGNGESSTEFEPSYTYPLTGINQMIVQLVAINEFGCMDTSYQEIDIPTDIIVYVPNTFTPNGDEMNTEFKPIIDTKLALIDFKFELYNRWGELIFESHDISKGWDGTYLQSMSPDGVYIWTLKFKDFNTDNVFQYHGHVNLLR